MRDWVDYILRVDEEQCGGKRLWSTGFHFADWLALDNPDKTSSFGGTDNTYVATAFYYYSALLTAKAAYVLGIRQDARDYRQLAREIKNAFRREYFSDRGELTVRTQTAMVLALYFGLAPKNSRKKIAGELKKNIRDHGMHLTTGFVGTCYLCLVLSECGMDQEAYSLLLQEEYPGWLYEVNMGATTVWERWNSILPDGHISDTGMNSLNHYAYGVIDPQGIGYQAAGGRTPSRSHHNIMVSGIFDKVPYNKEIIYIAHLFNDAQLIFQTFFQLLHIFRIPFFQTFITKLVQIFPGSIRSRHIEFRQFGHTEFNFHIAPVCNLLSIGQGLQSVGKQFFHLLRRFHIILPTLISHSVLILKALARLNTQKNIMGLRILCIGIMDIIGGYQLNSRLLAHSQKLLVD